MSKGPQPAKVELYFNHALQRTILIHTKCGEDCDKELAKYIDQFEDKPGYEVYINGQLYEIGNVSLPEVNVILNDTMDAQIWAKEWMKTIKDKPDIPFDEATMIAWFANAIMVGYDTAKRETEKE